MSMISSLNPTIVSSVDKSLASTRVRFCSAETTINSLQLEKGNIFRTPTSTVFTSLLISCRLLLRSILKTRVYSPPNTNVPF